MNNDLKLVKNRLKGIPAGVIRSTKRCGFGIRFDNGYTVSVQFGPATYSDNHRCTPGEDDEMCAKTGSHTAECAVFDINGQWVITPYNDEDNIIRYCTMDKVLAIMVWVEQQ